ncbi:MAG: hypothetical protein ABW133_18495, partial [Polyangiaceae bacterium]
MALAIYAEDGSLWAISRNRVAHYTGDGARIFSRPLAAYASNAGNGRKVAVNPLDGTAWVALERRVLHLDPHGALLSIVPGEATDLEVGQDGKLWVLDEDRDELRRYSSAGALLGTANLGGASRRARHIALDSLRGVVWLAADGALVRRSIAQPSQVLLRLDVTHDVASISVDPQTGELWVLGNGSLFAYEPDGEQTHARNLS